VAADLGIPDKTLRYWHEMAKRRKKGPPAIPRAGESAAQRLERLERENAQLRRENEELKMDRAILKKAAAFFAKESE
jgi:transposase